MSVTRHRPLTGAAAAVLLALAVTGCSGLGRTAVGTVSYDTADHKHVTVSNPLVVGCHQLVPAGAVGVLNDTLVDIIMYPTTDCSGGDSIYIASKTSDTRAPRAKSWRSYSLVH
ncbi:hypothetical protein [Streptomyces sp. CAU 1734]|uniref:hypothetical protein n=1 Tax=Streptomyces sp. CAU 1734 TaxID=3140360 RepID=UPI0032600B4A